MQDGDNIVYVMLRDTKVVTIMSTMHYATGTKTVVQKVKDKDGHLLRKEVPIPQPILDYNQNMGGDHYYLITTRTWVVLTCQIKQSATIITFFGRRASIGALSFFTSSI